MAAETGQNPKVLEHLFGPGKKRILALDGGGVRGIVTIAFLEHVERALREETGRSDLVLGDFFDMIGGTSVGSMLAVMLAMGFSVAEIKRLFLDWAPAIFRGRTTLIGPRRFDARQLVNRVRSVVGDAALDSEKLCTGLTLVAKRVDTGSPWVLSNNPKMPYFDDGDDWIGNRHYKLWRLIRASTSAPFLFTPTEIVIHEDEAGNVEKGLFVDGAVSPHNNPALQMLLQASLASYKLAWRLTPEDLLLISIGTGHHRTKVAREDRRILRGYKASLARLIGRTLIEDIEEASFAVQTLRGLVGDSEVFALQILQALSNPRFCWLINSEIGSLDEELFAANGALDGPVMSFQRYNLPLEMNLLAAEFDIAAPLAQRQSLTEIDNPDKMDELYTLGTEAAEKQVSRRDFAAFV